MKAKLWRARRAQAHHGVWDSMPLHSNDPFKRGDLFRNISDATQTHDLATWRAVRRLASQNESGRKWRKLLDAFRPTRREGRLWREMARPRGQTESRGEPGARQVETASLRRAVPLWKAVRGAGVRAARRQRFGATVPVARWVDSLQTEIRSRARGDCGIESRTSSAAKTSGLVPVSSSISSGSEGKSGSEQRAENWA